MLGKEDKKTTTITVGLTDALKERFIARTKDLGISSSILLRLLILHSLQLEDEEKKNPNKRNIEGLFTCYEHLTSSRETFVGSKTAKISVHVNEELFRDFNQFANSRIRHASSLLRILLTLFVEGIIKISIASSVSAVAVNTENG